MYSLTSLIETFVQCSSKRKTTVPYLLIKSPTLDIHKVYKPKSFYIWINILNGKRNRLRPIVLTFQSWRVHWRFVLIHREKIGWELGQQQVNKTNDFFISILKIFYTDVYNSCRFAFFSYPQCPRKFFVRNFRTKMENL